MEANANSTQLVGCTQARDKVMVLIIKWKKKVVGVFEVVTDCLSRLRFDTRPQIAQLITTHFFILYMSCSLLSINDIFQ